MDEKTIFCNAIENKKQEIIKEYNIKISEVLKENNPAKIYYLLSQIFHNTMKQGEIGIEFLKKNLTNAFFMEANIKNGVNYIIFFNKDFDVMISKSLSREIIIKYKNIGKLCYHYDLDTSIIKLADLIEIYLNKKTFKSFKELADYNCKDYKNNLIAKVMKYINTYKKCNKKLLDKIRLQQEQNKIQQLKAKEENKKYEERQLYAKAFVETLTDLEMFKTNGWYVTTIGIRDENGKIKIDY